MNRKLATAAIMTAAIGIALLGAPAQARPYLMLAADNTGFITLDLGAIRQDGIDTAQVTVISAPLAGARYGDKLAAMKKERLEFDCQGTRFRVVSVAYADAKDVDMGSETAAADWRSLDDQPLMAVSKDAACLRRYKQTLVSRDLNLGDIVANYHKAWSAPAAEPLTEKQLLKRKFDLGH